MSETTLEVQDRVDDDTIVAGIEGRPPLPGQKVINTRQSRIPLGLQKRAKELGIKLKTILFPEARNDIFDSEGFLREFTILEPGGAGLTNVLLAEGERGIALNVWRIRSHVYPDGDPAAFPEGSGNNREDIRRDCQTRLGVEQVLFDIYLGKKLIPSTFVESPEDIHWVIESAQTDPEFDPEADYLIKPDRIFDVGSNEAGKPNTRAKIVKLSQIEDEVRDNYEGQAIIQKVVPTIPLDSFLKIMDVTKEEISPTFDLQDDAICGVRIYFSLDTHAPTALELRISNKVNDPEGKGLQTATYLIEPSRLADHPQLQLLYNNLQIGLKTKYNRVPPYDNHDVLAVDLVMTPDQDWLINCLHTRALTPFIFEDDELTTERERQQNELALRLVARDIDVLMYFVEKAHLKKEQKKRLLDIINLKSIKILSRRDEAMDQSWSYQPPGAYRLPKKRS